LRTIRQAKTLTADEARRIAINIARLPERCSGRASSQQEFGRRNDSRVSVARRLARE
jgi:hypothetical protein